MRWALILFLGFNIVNISLRIITEHATLYKTASEIILLLFFVWGLILNIRDRKKPLSLSIQKQKGFIALFGLAIIVYIYISYNYYKAKNELNRNTSLNYSIQLTISTMRSPM
jgi:hypothetical protein